MFKTYLFILGFFLSSSFYAAGQDQKLTIERIRYFYYLKSQLANRNWPGFGLPRYDVTLAYFTKNQTYLIDPTGLVKSRRTVTSIYDDGKIRIGKTSRLDTVAFHMATAYEDRQQDILWYHNPIMLCSDLETTRNYVSEVPDIQTWATMVMHEYFHGFQFRHPAFLRFANDSISISNSRLQSYYDSYPWFKESVEKENELLLKCLKEHDFYKIKSLIKKYISMRNLRLKQFKEQEKFELDSQEDFLEKMEGSARYMEYQLYLAFKRLPTEKTLASMDTAYKMNAYKHFQIEDKQWMYESNSIKYFYSTGFNILRLLDKLHVNYKQHFFDNNSLTPNQLVANFVK